MKRRPRLHIIAVNRPSWRYFKAMCGRRIRHSVDAKARYDDCCKTCQRSFKATWEGGR